MDIMVRGGRNSQSFGDHCQLQLLQGVERDQDVDCEVCVSFTLVLFMTPLLTTDIVTKPISWDSVCVWDYIKGN